ncbi:hypothetical protein Vafri_13525 [Volvox africanus]|nr:hypothetical protein Vafri_13525 [Volvox africanus]
MRSANPCHIADGGNRFERQQSSRGDREKLKFKVHERGPGMVFRLISGPETENQKSWKSLALRSLHNGRCKAPNYWAMLKQMGSSANQQSFEEALTFFMVRTVAGQGMGGYNRSVSRITQSKYGNFGNMSYVRHRGSSKTPASKGAVNRCGTASDPPPHRH